jgi:hypothetical protein
MLIPKYYSCLDGPTPLAGLEFVEPDIRFLIVVPSGEVSGGYDELCAYIERRPPDVERVHHVLRGNIDRDLETIYGQVTERGRSIGSFVSVGRVSESGRLSHYQAFFHPDFGMYPPVS